MVDYGDHPRFALRLRWRVAGAVITALAGSSATPSRFNRLDKHIGDTAIDKIDGQVVGDLVAALHAEGLRKQTIRKTLPVLAMILDHAGIAPKPARSDKTSGYRVRLPHEDKRHVEPPTTSRLSFASSPTATCSRC